jgi:hypothetical protein
MMNPDLSARTNNSDVSVPLNPDVSSSMLTTNNPNISEYVSINPDMSVNPDLSVFDSDLTVDGVRIVYTCDAIVMLSSYTIPDDYGIL